MSTLRSVMEAGRPAQSSGRRGGRRRSGIRGAEVCSHKDDVCAISLMNTYAVM